MTRVFVVAGTGTDVGKTFASAVIADTFLRMGHRVSICKPIQTGTDSAATDPDALALLCPGVTRLPPELEIPFRFRFPASPDYAGRLEDRRMTASEVAGKIRDAVEAAPDILLVELAGGVMVPLNDSETNLDLMSQLDVPVILVTLAGLGTVNHTLLTLEAMERRGIPVAGMVVNRFPASSDLLAEDNAATLKRFSTVPILAVIPESDTLPTIDGMPFESL